LDGSVGLTSQTYTASGTSTSATVFSLGGTWNGYEPLILRPTLSRTINESALSNYQNYVSTVAGIDFTYDIHYPWKAVGGISYNTADYTPAPGVSGVNPRTDTFVKASIGLLYEVRPQYSIGPLYEYSQGSSTDVAAGGPQYSRNFFAIRLVARR
jgi:Putative beta-barrel porin 2